MSNAISKKVRLAEFLRRLEALSVASTCDEARLQIQTTLNRVEDELSGVPFDPKTYERMYSFQADSATELTDHPEIRAYRSLGHETLVGSNGAFEIRDLTTGTVLLRKLGSNGKGLWS